MNLLAAGIKFIASRRTSRHFADIIYARPPSELLYPVEDIMNVNMSSTMERHDADNQSQTAALIEEILRDDPGGDEVYLVSPSVSVLYDLAQITLDEDVDYRPLTVLLDEDVINALRRNFPLSSRLEDLRGPVQYVNADDEDLPDMALLSSPDDLLALISLGDTVRAFSTESADAPREAYDNYRGLPADLDKARFSTASRTQIYETLKDEFGEEIAKDHEALLQLLEDSDEISDEAIRADVIGVLVAAKYDISQYDIGHWAESTGVASRATFSRRKQRLEEQGMVETSKIQIDVGRPRSRLHLADDSKDSLPELAEMAIDALK